MVTFHMRQRSPLVGFCVRQCAVADDNTEIIGLGDNYTGSSNCRSPGNTTAHTHALTER
jgi:hypothetical protein